ncbi:MAG: GDP-mannose 4,6-dehydratase [Candidatus Diapherotrites archaeon]|uniref:GDP-mannose 4,6-dehydratase n=1 Tax=Candidatus Iainarchaeum sp. TaxID=3101447 RepID=A0A7J4IWD9_9ARCH|nr:MAG: CDP-paratose 2-epimerase [archaeon GW2011_AR10]MBS3058959.1 GDP-mannose 4,6-dehydratase [Candidatus Diapherotrites archaeon]HIH08589.1 NAD-dependent epimerase/dehydratase family protein [Candidatus Diapherotrites archaeon]
MSELVIGGAGFIGVNLAERLLQHGKKVVVFDNFSRKGTDKNIEWLKKNFPSVKVVKVDIRKDLMALENSVKDAENVYHMAAQVAVTTSVTNPREDFEINALGTFNVLEAMRKTESNAMLVFASTNKVYGALEQVEIEETAKRFDFKKLKKGVSEEMPLDFHSPYGCSKGAADQYVRDYNRIYGLNTVVMRQSCIYGKRQFGIEDQGWVAWFSIATLLNKKITLYGNGKQVRDVLDVRDLVDAFELVVKNKKKTTGEIFNVGGGPANAISLLEFLEILEHKLGKKISYKKAGERPGDQPVYISNNKKIEKTLGWTPKISYKKGINDLVEWITQNKETIKEVLQ